MGDESELRTYMDTDDFFDGQPPAADDPVPAEGDAGAAGAGGWSDVMAELRDRVPENSGRWTASQAAQFDQYLDPADPAAAAFFDETGLGAASDAASAASSAINQALNTEGGSYSADQYAAMVQTGTDVQHALLDADEARSRYQQTTDFGDAAMLADRHASLDAGTSAVLADAAANPAAHGIDMTPDEMQAYQQAALDATSTEGA